jgi:hypothetical protein
MGMPLVYVIRKPTFIQDLNPCEKLVINNASLAGAVFHKDSQRVLTLLQSLMTGTDAENSMQGVTCGCIVMQALQAQHYTGDT